MGYPEAYYTKAMSIIDERKRKNTAITEQRYIEITEKFPRAKEIRAILADTIHRLVGIITSGRPDAEKQIASLKDENLGLQEELKKILVNNGYPEDYLSEIYTCPACKDTGYVNGIRCECFKDELKKLAAQELSKSLPMGLTSFDNFNLSYYPEEKRDDLGGRTPRDIMKQNFDFCKDYADNFTPHSLSLLFTGGTGLGKTHLSLSIAREVIDKGYSVVYGSAPDLLRRIENQYFGNGDDEALETVKTCDLLIFDDLGAEINKQFYISCIYDIINSRLNYSLPTIVSTNLEAEEIQARYTDRIASRLLSMKRRLFCGKDIRVLNKSR